MQATKNLFVFLFWTCIIALSVYFFIDNVLIYFNGYRSTTFGTSFFNNQFWVLSHLVGGSIALFLGPVQFWKSVRTNYTGLHRTGGKIYILGAILTGLSATRLSLVSTCQPCRVSLFILAILVLVTTIAAWYSIKNKNIKAHKQFMVRSYVTVLSFVAVRIDGVFPMGFLFGDIADPTFNRTVNEYFFSFVPLLVTEMIMTWLPALQTRKLPTRSFKPKS
jgi:uncharacterized membrane protein